MNDPFGEGLVMKMIVEGAEHHFLTFLEKLKVNPSGWIACTFPFSKNLDHGLLVSKRAFIHGELAKREEEVKKFVDSISGLCEKLPEAVLYRFADNDVILLCCPNAEAEQKLVRETLEAIAKTLPPQFCEYGFLTKELYVYQKLSDHKILSAKKMQAYKMLGDDMMVESLSVRRKKRSDPIVLVVEDDRFTASYISGFLRDFDMVIARNGEEAILKYMEYAPDAVFLDIHLPGINGHQVLQAMKAVDSDAFVVMLSVDTAKSSILSASEKGAVSYLKKPFSRERVLNTLRLSPFIRESKGILPVQGAKTP